MKCPFCQKECMPENFHQVPKGLVGYRCEFHAHPVSLVAVPNETYFSYFFTCWYNQREYSLECYKLPQGDSSALQCGSETIFALKFIPKDLTPDNIDSRIKTLLLFS